MRKCLYAKFQSDGLIRESLVTKKLPRLNAGQCAAVAFSSCSFNDGYLFHLPWLLALRLLLPGAPITTCSMLSTRS